MLKSIETSFDSGYSGTWTHFLFFPFLDLIFHKAIFLFVKLWLNISVTLMDLYFSFLVYFSLKKQFKSTVWSKIILLSLYSSTLKSTLSLWFFFKCIHYIENHNEKAFCSDIKFISCCFFESVHVCAWLLNWPCIFFNSTCGGYWLQKKRNNESISILCLLILSKLKIYKISWECRSIQQCVRLPICQSDSLSATMLINSRSSIHDILHKSFTFPSGIPFENSFQTVGRYYLTLGIIQRVT